MDKSNAFFCTFSLKTLQFFDINEGGVHLIVND